MGPKTFRNVILLAGVALGAFVYYDPLRPSEEEAKAAILAAILADSGEEVTAVKVEHSFMGRRVDDHSQSRLWPAHATIMKGNQELPYHEFYLMKGYHDKWTAALNDPDDKHWEREGALGVNRFGL